MIAPCSQTQIKSLRNNPVLWFRRLGQKDSDPITFVHQRRYWTQYLEKALESDSRFALRRFADASPGYESAAIFSASDPRTKNIVVAYAWSPTRQTLTRQHRVLVRVQHSPGFGLATFVAPYDRIKKEGLKLMIPRHCWELLLKTNQFKDDVLKKRDQILKDGTPLVFTFFDPKLNRIFNAPKQKKKKPGTALVSCNFRIVNNEQDIHKLIEAIKHLSKELEVAVHLHPLISEKPQPLLIKQPASALLNALQSVSVKRIVTQDAVEALIDLYDEHEFIITDGSGTAYEAIARGCKALTLEGLSYQTNKELFHSTFELGLMPRTRVWDYKNHPGDGPELEWLKGLYPSSLVKEDVVPAVAQEIIDVFERWR